MAHGPVSGTDGAPARGAGGAACAGGIHLDPARAAGAHASQPVAASSGLAAPARRRMGSTGASGAALSGAERPARLAGESGRSQTGRLLLGYGRSIQVGADGFGLHPDQRWRRCAGLFEAESRVTDPVAFLKRLHHKGRYRAGRARAVLDRLKGGLSGWLGWRPYAGCRQRLVQPDLSPGKAGAGHEGSPRSARRKRRSPLAAEFPTRRLFSPFVRTGDASNGSPASGSPERHGCPCPSRMVPGCRGAAVVHHHKIAR